MLRGDGRRPEHIYFILAGLFLLNLLLRVFYLRYDFVNGDEGVRAITAVRMLDGARLYADIVTDKPPGTTLFYAAAFALFGRSMAAVHLAAAVWNFATSIIIYLAAASLYGRRAGLWAALLFIYFSTNYYTQDMMAANTELLMALPYTASFYLFLKSRGGDRAGLLGAGFLAGVATLFKQVGVFNLVFFFLAEALEVYGARAGGLVIAWRSVVRLLLVGAGFIAALAPAALWLWATGAIAGFYRNAIVLGALYVNALPTGLWINFLIGRTGGYVLFNAALWSLALWPLVRSARKRLRGESSEQERIDLTVGLWGAASLLGVFAGGRFFGHYFIQLLPALALLASRGTELLRELLSDPARRRKGQVIMAALVLMFAVGFVRFHHRTAVLAYETLTGARTHKSAEWGMTEREAEAEMVVAALRDKVGAGEPLYIYGYALDVYWRLKARPASRYLAPYYITGHFPESTEPLDRPGEQFWSEARTHLIDDLSRARPRLILDVEGSLQSLPYPEVKSFLKENYRYEGKISADPARPFHVFRLIE